MTVTDSQLREYTLLGRDGARETLMLELLGSGTSFAEGKTRWFEVNIFADADGNYVVHTVGRTTVEGERDLGRIERTSSPYDVVELVTVRRKSSRHGTGTGRRAEPYVPVASTRALAQAADVDDGLNEAYLRLVA
jgi:hypothetical protein